MRCEPCARNGIRFTSSISSFDLGIGWHFAPCDRSMPGEGLRRKFSQDLVTEAFHETFFRRPVVARSQCNGCDRATVYAAIFTGAARWPEAVLRNCKFQARRQIRPRQSLEMGEWRRGG